MCLSIPGKVISVKENTANVDISGLKVKVNTMLIDHVKAGDYVLVHTGFAIQKYDKEDAKETLRLLKKGGSIA